MGLSTAATEVMQTAITMHYTPGGTTAAGTEAYLLAAGAAGRGWRPELDPPPQTLNNAVRDYPRVGFKKAFADAFRAEAVRVPQGRAKFVNRYGALHHRDQAGPIRRVRRARTAIG